MFAALGESIEFHRFLEAQTSISPLSSCVSLVLRTVMLSACASAICLLPGNCWCFNLKATAAYNVSFQSAFPLDLV